MMTRDNPFPGMNPFLERHWTDVHTKLIAYISDEIAAQLPLDLNARTEEHVTLLQPGEKDRGLRADVAVVEAWKSGYSPDWQPDAAAADGLVATEPLLVLRDEEVERWIEITDRNGKLVTVIEVLSPFNKGDGADDYRKRRDDYIRGRINLVEIDLLRAGAHVVSGSRAALNLELTTGTVYITCVSRAARTHLLEAYVTPLRNPLPVVRVPLRVTDHDVLLALQPLIDRCYRMGAYWNADQRNVPGPELIVEERDWVEERVRAAGLEG